MIFDKTQVNPEISPGGANIPFRPKSVAFNVTHSVYVDIFILPSKLTHKYNLQNSAKHDEIIDVSIVRNYFEVSTFDGNCDFLWGETIDDELSVDSLLTVYQYESIYDVIEQKSSMIHRKMQQELKQKDNKQNIAKI